MRILFITPPFHAGVVEVAGRWVPLHLVYLAGAARAAGHEAHIYDAMTKFVGYEEIRQRIIDVKPDVVATTAITATSVDALEIMKLTKSIDPSIVTLCGGIHASFMYEEMFSLTDALDYICVGEGEETIVEFLNCLERKGDMRTVRGMALRDGDGAHFTGKRAWIKSLDNAPRAFDLLDWEDYTYYMVPGSTLGALDTSRGCEKKCTFCSQQKFWEQTWRARSPEDLVSDMEYQAKHYGVNVVLLTDDYPTPDQARWERFLDLLIERDMGILILMETRAEDIIRDREFLHKYRAAGIIHIYVGTEATDESTLEYIKKDLNVEESKLALSLCRDAGIITETSMILGFPDDTVESTKRTIALVKEFNPDFAHFLAIAPWPYSDLYKELEPHIVEFDYRKYNLIDPVVKPTNMTLQEVDQQIVNGYRDFYMGKLMEMMGTKDKFKRDYLMNAMKRMMSNSFIKKKLGMLGEMPKEIKAIIDSKLF